jgi:hypothetical protein
MGFIFGKYKHFDHIFKPINKLFHGLILTKIYGIAVAELSFLTRAGSRQREILLSRVK